MLSTIKIINNLSSNKSRLSNPNKYPNMQLYNKLYGLLNYI